MAGALDLDQPSHLLEKLSYEVASLEGDRSNRYAALNAIHDAYHLREWIWHARLEHNSALQTAIMGASGDESHWNQWINQQFPDFSIIRELCNGAKHFESGKTMRLTTHRGGFDSVVPFFDNPDSGFDDNGYHVQIDGSRVIAMIDLLPVSGNSGVICSFLNRGCPNRSCRDAREYWNE